MKKIIYFILFCLMLFFVFSGNVFAGNSFNDELKNKINNSAQNKLLSSEIFKIAMCLYEIRDIENSQKFDTNKTENLLNIPNAICVYSKYNKDLTGKSISINNKITKDLAIIFNNYKNGNQFMSGGKKENKKITILRI